MKKGKDYTGVSIVYLCHDGQGKYLLAKRSTNCRDELANGIVAVGVLSLVTQ